MNDLENLNVLYVEDSPTQALLLKESLEKNHFKVQLAKDGVEGLQKIEETLPQIILSDIEMPRMNGYDFCKHIKTDPKKKNIPVLLLTNLTDVQDVVKGIGCGADSFLTKPCEINLLISTIRNALKNNEVKAPTRGGRLEFFFDGKTEMLDIDQAQVTKLLFSTYTTAMQKNLELEEAYRNLSRTHEEIERNNEQLKELINQKNQFLGMAAHDLRNPLMVISGFSELLLSMSKEELAKENVHQILKNIQTSSNFMLNLIHDFLDYSVIESGTVKLNLSEVSLIELIENNMIFYDSLANKKNIKIDFTHPLHVRSVTCDPNKIVQVLNNIVTNAIKFSHPNGSLKIGLLAFENEVTITIEDTGIGMTQDAIKTLFEPFSKAKAIGTAGEKGTGLGLAIVHKIIIEHKGNISVKSEVGKGSIFYITLPYTQTN